MRLCIMTGLPMHLVQELDAGTIGKMSCSNVQTEVGSLPAAVSVPQDVARLGQIQG